MLRYDALTDLNRLDEMSFFPYIGKQLNTKGDHNGPQSISFKRTGTYFATKLVGP
jgi:hypothetical protein